MLGDFSGKANRSVTNPGAHRAASQPILIDRDNFDQVMTKLDVELRLPLAGRGGAGVRLHFAELDDFDPDRIFERTEFFQKPRAMRKRLADPETFQQAAAEFGIPETPRESPAAEEPAFQAAAQAPQPSALVTADLLAGAIEATERRGAEPRSSRGPEIDDLSAFLKKVVAPYTVAGPDPRQEQALSRWDAAIASQMRALLHHSEVQALEAAWRSLFFLIDRLETGPRLKVYLIDISKAELAADLMTAKDLRSTATYRLLVEQTVGTLGGEPWAVVIGNYTLGPSLRDAEVLGRIAMIAELSGAPFVSGASARLLGCESFAETPDPDDWTQPMDSEAEVLWQAIRRLPEASYIGLALPRFLLRLPYGKDTVPTESFVFEEMPGSAAQQGYLWGNPAFACAYLLGRAFGEDGWNLRPARFREIDRLPLHIHEHQGETVAKPCAEALLSERAAERITDKGLMPLLSVKDQDSARLLRFQSLAHPPASLAGRWN